MKFSYNWIADMVEGLDTPPADLMRLITMKTAECEGLEAVGVPMDRACAARIVTVEPIEGSTHNKKAVVETLAYGMRTVVCGAPNCREGLVTAYLPLAPKEIEGVVSDGMLASPAELGLTRDHSGIVEWSSDARLRPDNVIEVDNKSLTHRPDLWGHFGMAREVAAILHKQLRDPVPAPAFPHARSPVQIEIPDLTLCPRYSALVFDNVKVGPSPLWLQYRLESIGLNPINNIVDVTNYVMSEIGQPMHAFDAAKLRGTTIYARLAKAGEHITALNEESYTLSPANLVIADETGPIAIAGVIGGLESAIDNGTRRVVLESACFQAASVRRTSSTLKLRTDASMRFEKAQDPTNTVRGLTRALELLSQVSPGIRMVGGLADRHAEFKTPPPIDLPLDWLQRKLGRPIEERQVRGILESLGFKVNGTSVTVPSWRATKDISIKDDLLEEVGRIVGYDCINPTAPLVASAVPPADPRRVYLRQLKQVVADQGFTEVHNYSFISEEMAQRFGFDPAAHVRVENPISSDQTLMRISLLPGIWKSILENSKHLNAFRMFEIGREIRKKNGGELPDEIPHLVAAIFARDDGAAGLFEIKRLAECFMPGCQVIPVEARPFEHPERSAEIEWRGERLGRLFELHPSMDVDGRAAILDVDLARAEKLAETPKRYRPFRRFPTSAFDLSVMVPLREPVSKIENRLRALAADDLVAIEFVRQYTGAPLPADLKSVSYRVTVGAPDRTLSSEEVGAIRSRLIEGLQSDGYELRL
ncbi:MAG TPA: phenylalanine--tRNA ligase subunit beta [Bryobacteraceae bacterium]|nr:phenylalanine--tRNA ligase subunit beta [Bryobacteraceae bacterium]